MTTYELRDYRRELEKASSASIKELGGNVSLTYAALFPDHPGGVILANTTRGHRDPQRVIEAFGRLGGDARLGRGIPPVDSPDHQEHERLFLAALMEPRAPAAEPRGRRYGRRF